MKVKSKPGRGGYRPGAGAKAADGAVIVGHVSAAVDEVTATLIEEFGGGNVSLGVRKMAAELHRLRNSGTVHAPTTKVVKTVVTPAKPKIKYAGRWVD